ncbi:hypothetical protein BH11BAC3_BH11BAC3_07620 [soil metagenome]
MYLIAEMERLASHNHTTKSIMNFSSINIHCSFFQVICSAIFVESSLLFRTLKTFIFTLPMPKKEKHNEFGFVRCQRAGKYFLKAYLAGEK